jgi:hypothetical protein
MANEKTGKTITLAAAKAFADRLGNDVTPAEVQAAFDQEYEEIESCLRRGFTVDDAVLSTIVNMNLYMD